MTVSWITISISLVFWLAAVLTLVQALFGTFHPHIDKEDRLLALKDVPVSAVLFYFAAHLCGLV